jgi:hypothetical protein
MSRLKRFLLAIMIPVSLLLIFHIVGAQPFSFISSKNHIKDSDRAASSKLKAVVEKLSTEFIPRNYANTENLNRTAEYIKSELQMYDPKTSMQNFEIEGKKFSNVIASFGPENAATLVIGAHYDAFSNLPGADDNASGVAGLLELARLLAKHPPRAIRVELVAYTLEEPPFFATDQMGSFVHAKSLREKNANVVGMLSLEMIGYFTDEKWSQNFPSPLMRLLYPSAGNFIAVIGDYTNYKFTGAVKSHMSVENGIPVYSMNGPAFIPGIDWSDHRNYWAHEMNAVMITDTSFYRNTAYHTPQDTFDRLDYTRMAQVVDGVFNVVLNFDRQSADGK